MKLISIRRQVLAVFYVMSSCLAVVAHADVMSLFPLDNYSQTVEDWVQPCNPNYDTPLMLDKVQQQRFDIFYNHYFGISSPWSMQYVNTLLTRPAPNDIATTEHAYFSEYSNQNKASSKIGYGINFRPYDANWTQTLLENDNPAQFVNLIYNTDNRAIAINNSMMRILPTQDPWFLSNKIAGEGYPFDHLQNSAVWAGTPLYILGETRDHAWSLVLTPDFISWMKTRDLARCTEEFINTWKTQSKSQLAAITQTQTSLATESGQFLLTAYIGSVFPAEKTNDALKLMIPVANDNHLATISYALAKTGQAAMMPMLITPRQIATVMHELVNRPYSWGNAYFYNDCSAELKSLFTPFGIWLPRHSSAQVTVGKMDDLSSSTAQERVAYLLSQGKPWTTIIYIGGHVMLYAGSFKNPNSTDHMPMAMTYQNIWGLRPATQSGRSVIGQAAFLPVLLQYPEDPSLGSLANKDYFQISYLDQFPAPHAGLQATQPDKVDVRELMSPQRD